jgi:hypothetical protein
VTSRSIVRANGDPSQRAAIGCSAAAARAALALIAFTRSSVAIREKPFDTRSTRPYFACRQKRPHDALDSAKSGLARWCTVLTSSIGIAEKPGASKAPRRLVTVLVAALGTRCLGEPHTCEVEQEIEKLGIRTFADEASPRIISSSTGVARRCVRSTSRCAIDAVPVALPVRDGRVLVQR